MTAVVGVTGLISVFSFNRWQDVSLWDMTPFVLLDTLVANLILPLTGLGIAVFVGWRMRPEVLRDELFVEPGHLFSLWRWVLRYIAAPGVLLVLAFMLYELARRW